MNKENDEREIECDGSCVGTGICACEGEEPCEGLCEALCACKQLRAMYEEIQKDFAAKSSSEMAEEKSS